MFSMIVRLGLAAGLGVTATCGFAADDKPRWGYEGAHGPAHWAGLNKDNLACAGAQQSPIDLVATHEADNEDISVDWQGFKPEVVNNGHTIQANAPSGQKTKFGNDEYDFLQVHFHAPSEHTIDGKHFPLEAHFVHKGADGSLMVLGVMLEPGEEDAEIARLWKAAPAKPGKNAAQDAVELANLIPNGSDYFRYSGSLTTPPCSEVVNWVVYRQTMSVSQEQIDAFTRLYTGNNRPVQALNRRFILVGR